MHSTYDLAGTSGCAASDGTVPLTATSDICAMGTHMYPTNDLYDQVALYPTSIDTGCSEIDVTSLLDCDSIMIAGDPNASLFSDNQEVAVPEPVISEAYLEELQFYVDDPEYFRLIVEAAIDNKPAASELAVSPEPYTSAVSSTSVPEPFTISPALSLNSNISLSPLPSLLYPDSSDSEERVQTYFSPYYGGSPPLFVNGSPVPSLFYPDSSPTEERIQLASLQSSPSTSSPVHSPVPSLFYRDTSDGDNRSSYTDDSPALSPILEQSVLGKAFRAVGAKAAPSCMRKHPKYSPYPSTSPHMRHNSPSRNREALFDDFVLPGTPRNVQSPLDPSSAILTYTDGAFRCPVPGCSYVPHSTRRTSDVRRHLETHRSSENQQRWVCCGVPVARAAEFGITDVNAAYWWRGWRMVGGCRRGYSRRDSLGRHFKTCGCKGHVDMAEELTEANDRALNEVDGHDLGY